MYVQSACTQEFLCDYRAIDLHKRLRLPSFPRRAVNLPYLTGELGSARLVACSVVGPHGALRAVAAAGSAARVRAAHLAVEVRARVVVTAGRNLRSHAVRCPVARVVRR